MNRFITDNQTQLHLSIYAYKKRRSNNMMAFLVFAKKLSYYNNMRTFDTTKYYKYYKTLFKTDSNQCFFVNTKL